MELREYKLIFPGDLIQSRLFNYNPVSYTKKELKSYKPIQQEKTLPLFEKIELKKTPKEKDPSQLELKLE